MAQLTAADLRFYLDYLKRDPARRQQLRAQDLTRPTFLAIFQALEDSYDGARVSFKASMDAAAGRTLSPAFARLVEEAWQQRNRDQGT